MDPLGSVQSKCNRKSEACIVNPFKANGMSHTNEGLDGGSGIHYSLKS